MILGLCMTDLAQATPANHLWEFCLTEFDRTQVLNRN